jgi:hypothetical protein
MGNNEERFRLRNDNKIVGFERRLGSSNFYSTDEYSWSGKVLEGIQKDPCTGRKDINNRMIYSDDILTWVVENQTLYCVVHFDEVLNQFQALSMDGDEVLVDFFTNTGFSFSVKRVSYLFVQPF